MAEVGGLRVHRVVHGSVNHQVAVVNTTADCNYCGGSRLSIGCATGVFYGKGSGEQSGLQNQRRASWASCDGIEDME